MKHLQWPLPIFNMSPYVHFRIRLTSQNKLYTLANNTNKYLQKKPMLTKKNSYMCVCVCVCVGVQIIKFTSHLEFVKLIPMVTNAK
jgi:hypothetical protein